MLAVRRTNLEDDPRWWYLQKLLRDRGVESVSLRWTRLLDEDEYVEKELNCDAVRRNPNPESAVDTLLATALCV